MVHLAERKLPFSFQEELEKWMLNSNNLKEK